jgi:capsular polysaccharide biosynthesis protein
MARAALVAIRARIRLVIACAILLPAISIAVALLAASNYEATTRLGINAANSDPTLVNLGITGLQPPTGGDMTSDGVLRQVQDQLAPTRSVRRRGGGRRVVPAGPPPVSLGELRSRLVVSEDVGGGETAGTRSVALIARGTTAREASGLANVWASAIVANRNAHLANALQKAKSRLKTLAARTRAAGSPSQADRIDRQVTRIETAAASIDPDTQVIQAATLTSRPARFLNPLLALVLGLPLGIALALLLALVDRRLRTAATIRAAFGMPLLGHLIDATGGGDSDPTQRIRSATNLMSRLTIMNGGKTPSTLLLAPGDPETDSSRAARALSATLAASGRSVLMVNWSARFVDGRGRRAEPVGQKSGISVLDWTGDWRDLESRVKELGEGRDVVVINAPPVVTVSEALLAAQSVETWVICATIGITQRDHATTLTSELETLPKSPAGLITMDPPIEAAQAAPAKQRRRWIPLPRLRRRKGEAARQPGPAAGPRRVERKEPLAAATPDKGRKRSSPWIRRRKVAEPRQEPQGKSREHR